MKKLNKVLLKENIEKRINEHIASGMVGGCAAMVMQDGEVVYKNYFSSEGFDINEKTAFRLASMTKPITAAAVLICIDRGLLDLEDKVSKFVPGFAKMKIGKMNEGALEIVGDAEKEITILHLLTHTSGLGSGDVGNYALSKMTWEKEQSCLREAVEHYSRSALDFEPFSAQFYSAIFGFDVLARVVEIVSGKEYNVFIRENILEPLGMDDTTFTPTDEQRGRLVPMHDYVDGKAVAVDFPVGGMFEGLPLAYFMGGAGLAATMSDYSKFAEMLLNYGEYNGKRIISRELIESMGTPHVPHELMPYSERWGLGVRVIVNDEYKRLPVGAYGWSGAYGTHFWVDPENKITAIYMKNSRFDGGSGAETAAHFEEDVTNSFEA
ncbi:MAG: beta-lactamase family protein [Ruminococcaceae bacterium]|nr:beta-lactamase family protein [Oscillospiraceae bacterium]